MQIRLLYTGATINSVPLSKKFLSRASIFKYFANAVGQYFLYDNVESHIKMVLHVVLNDIFTERKSHRIKNLTHRFDKSKNRCLDSQKHGSIQKKIRSKWFKEFEEQAVVLALATSFGHVGVSTSCRCILLALSIEETRLVAE